MRQLFCSDEVIEALVVLNCGQHGSIREKHVLRESLRNLVRLAKVEEAEALRIGSYPLSLEPTANVLH